MVAFALSEAHEVGTLLAKKSVTDVVDAHVALIGSRVAGTVITSDPEDLRVPATHKRPTFAVVAVD